MNHLTRNRKGISLVELLVALAILNLVLAIGYGLYYFGTRSFSVGETRSNVQQNVRTAAHFITDELRYATSVTVLGAIPGTPEVNINYIYVKNGELKHTKGGVESNAPSVIPDGTSFEDLIVSSSDGSSLHFTISAKKATEQPFEIATEVQILNFNNIAPASGQVISYLSIPPTSASVTPNAVLADSSISQTFNITLTNEKFLSSFSSADVTHGGTYSGTLTLGSVAKTSVNSATVSLSGILNNVSGDIVLTLKSSGLLGNNDLQVTISVLEVSYGLTGLSLSPGTMTPAFSNSELSYTLSIAASVKSVTVTPYATGAPIGTIITVTNKTSHQVDSGTSLSISASFGDVISIVVTEPEKAPKNYVVNLIKQ